MKKIKKIDFNEMMRLLLLGTIDCNPQEVPHLYNLQNCLQTTVATLTQQNACCQNDSKPLPSVTQVRDCWPHYEGLRRVVEYDSRYHERVYVAINMQFELIRIGKVKLIPNPHELLHLVNVKHKIGERDLELTKEEKHKLDILSTRKKAMDGACCQTRRRWEGELNSTYALLVSSLDDTSPLVLNLKKAENVDTLYFYLESAHLQTL